EMLRQKPACQPILTRQRAVGEPVLNRKLRDLLIDPVPAGAAELELENEIQRYAFLQRFLEGRIESNVELSVENVAILFEQQLGRLDADRVRAGSGDRQPQHGRTQQAGEDAVRWQHATCAWAACGLKVDGLERLSASGRGLRKPRVDCALREVLLARVVLLRRRRTARSFRASHRSSCR